MCNKDYTLCMYVCMCVYMYVCIYVCICARMRGSPWWRDAAMRFRCVYVCVCVYIYIYICMYLYAYAWEICFKHICTTQAELYVCTYTHTNTHTHSQKIQGTKKTCGLRQSQYAFIYAYVHTHIYTHTHSQKRYKELKKLVDLDRASMHVCMYV